MSTVSAVELKVPVDLKIEVGPLVCVGKARDQGLFLRACCQITTAGFSML